LHQLPERPDADQTARLMSHFAPHRSLATMHLWTCLKEAAVSIRQNYWSLIESPFQKFAPGWMRKAGCLAFNLRATGAAMSIAEARNNSRKLAEVQRQVSEYAKGTRREFDLELAMEGPEFDKKVWAALLDIPYGATNSYGAVAKSIGQPGRRVQWARQTMAPTRFALIVPAVTG
jgi:O6-methylguanine-DNA--protein-cysteine methyltransferase